MGKRNTRLCWRCGYKRYEWTGLKWYIHRRGKCFWCRADDIDEKYGIQMLAEITRVRGFSTSRWRVLKLRLVRRFL